MQEGKELIECGITVAVCLELIEVERSFGEVLIQGLSVGQVD